jgi:Uncharacterized conserved protein
MGAEVKPPRDAGQLKDSQQARDALNPPLSQRGLVRLRTQNGRVLELNVEIASNDEDRARGLMFRRSLDEMAGMVFVFAQEQQLSFWMENTLIPLDMIFVRSDGTILGIVEEAEPMTRTSRRVEGASRFVLEVKGGFSARHGISPGDTMELVGMYQLE